MFFYVVVDLHPVAPHSLALDLAKPAHGGSDCGVFLNAPLNALYVDSTVIRSLGSDYCAFFLPSLPQGPSHSVSLL